MANDALDTLWVEFAGNYDRLMNAPAIIGSIFDEIASLGDDLASSLTASFDLMGSASNAFADIASLGAESVSSSMFDNIPPAIDNVDTAFGDMAANVGSAFADMDSQITSMQEQIESAAGSTGGGLLDMFNKINFGVMGFQNLANMAGNLAQGLLGPAMASQQMAKSFDTLMGSTQAANEELAKLTDFANNKTPFKATDVDAMAASMIGFHMQAQDVIPTLTAIGDNLSAIGKNSPASTQTVIDVLGKMTNEGKLSLGTITELSRDGIDAWGALERATGKNQAQLTQMIKSGLIPAKDAIGLLTTGIEDNPIYKGQMAAQMGTLAGLLSSTSSVWNTLMSDFGTPIITALQGTLGNINNLLGSDGFQSFATGVGNDIVNVFTDLGNAASGAWNFLKGFDLSPITSAMSGLEHAVDGMLSPLESLGSNKAVTGFFSTLKDDLGAGITASIEGIGNLIGGFSQGLQSLSGDFKNFTAVAQSLGSWWDATMEPAIARVMPDFQKLGSVIAADVVPAFEHIESVGQRVAKDLFPPLTQAFETIMPIVVKVSGFLANELGKALQFITPYAVQAAETIGSFADGLITRVVPVIEELWGAINSGIEILLPMWNSVWPTISGVLTGTWEVISGAVKVGWSLISGIIDVGLDLLSGNWGKAWDDIESAFGGVWDGIQGIAKGAWDGLGSIIKGGINLIIEAIDGFIGFIDGIQIHIPAIGVGPVHTPALDWNGLGIPKIPFLATGGDLAPGQIGVAGEAGPELIFGGTSGMSVLSHAQSMAAMGGEIHLHNENRIYIDGREMTNQMMVQVLNQIRSSGHPLQSIA